MHTSLFFFSTTPYLVEDTVLVVVSAYLEHDVHILIAGGSKDQPLPGRNQVLRARPAGAPAVFCRSTP